MNDLTTLFQFDLPTRILYGPGCIGRIVDQLAAYGGKRPLIVTDQGVRRAGILNQVTALLEAAGIPCCVYDGVEANPKDTNVAEGVRVARNFSADSIVAVGGGSPIDCAKSIGVLMAHGGEDIKRYEGKTAATKPLPLLISVPTTSGTGSELTFSSVITDTKNNYKMTVKSPYTAAKVAVCDPELTLSVPPHVTAATGVDALTHAIEAYTATCAEPISDAVALYAIELIYGNLVAAVRNGADLQARSAMLMGSMLAGIAFSHSDVASVHCVAESLGGVYDLPHGVCNAIFLPHVMAYNMPFCIDRYARVARAMGLPFETPEQGAKAAVAAVQQLAKDVELPLFSTLPVRESDFDRIADMSVKNISTESNPRPMSREDYLKVLQMAFQAK